MWPILEVGKDGQLSEESRMINSRRSLKRFPGLSISLEPHPQSGDPEVKVTELSSGTPIAPVCQRLSLERIGRKLQLAEGLKCALSSSNPLEAHDFCIMKPGEWKGQEEDHTFCIKNTKGPDAVSKPSMMQELLQRPSIGINLALNQEDRRDMVRTRSLVIHDMKFGLEKLNKSSSTSTMPVDEPIRLPIEDSLAGLARAREEELRSRCPRSVNKCLEIQEDNSEEDFFGPRESQAACKDSSSNPYGETMGRAPLKSPVGSVELGDKTMSYHFADEPTWGVKEHGQENEKDVEMVDTSGGVPMSALRMETGHAATDMRERPTENEERLDMVDRQMGGLLEAGPVLDTMRAEGLKMGDSPDAGRVLDGENKGTKHLSSANSDMAQLVYLLNAKGAGIADTKTPEKLVVVTCTSDDGTFESEEDTRCEEGQEIMSGSLQMEMRMPQDRTEANEATSVCASFDYTRTSSEASNGFEHDELPLTQHEATVIKPFPMMLDFLNPEVIRSRELDNLLASYHSTATATPHSTKPSYNGLQGDPLMNLQCRLCILETSQEVDLLWKEIKRRTCLMALQRVARPWDHEKRYNQTSRD